MIAKESMLFLKCQVCGYQWTIDATKESHIIPCPNCSSHIPSKPQADKLIKDKLTWKEIFGFTEG